MRFVLPWKTEEENPVPQPGGRWGPFIGPFLTSVAEQVPNDSEYYSDLMDAESPTNKTLQDQLNSRERGAPATTATLVRGYVGAGKTSFWLWWLNENNLRHRAAIIDLNDGSKWDKPQDVDVNQAIACKLDASIQNNSTEEAAAQYMSDINARIETIRTQRSIALNSESFIDGFKNQSPEFKAKYPHLNCALHLTCVIAAIHAVTKKPVWIVIDNVDLHSRASQTSYIDYAHSIHSNTKSQCADRNWIVQFYVVVTAREETYQFHKRGSFVGYGEIIFPAPDVIAITIRKMKLALNLAAQAEAAAGNTLSFSIHGEQFPSWNEIGNRIMLVVEKSISETATITGQNPSGWHGKVVDYNTRRFVKHWSSLMLRANFCLLAVRRGWAERLEGGLNLMAEHRSS